MRPKLLIYGARDNGGRFACEYRDNGKYKEYEVVGFIDDFMEGEFLGFPILGKATDLPALKEKGIDHIVVSLLTEPIKRLAICQQLETIGFHFPSFHAYLPKEMNIGKGVYVDETATVLGYAGTIEDFAVIGPQAVIEGRTSIGRGTIISPFVFIGYEAEIGDATVFYPGSSCLPKVKIGTECVIFPHVVVHKNMKDSTRKKR